jgi:hypothetical protein
MALLTYSATPAKGSTVTVTLDKAELLALNAVGIDSFWTGGSDGDVVQAIVTLKTFPGNGKITLTFDLSQATPTAPLTLPQYARDVFQISKIVVVDTMGDKIAIPRATLLTEIPTLSESEVNLSGNLAPPTIAGFDSVFVPEIPRFRFDIADLADDVAGNVDLTIYQLTQLPADLAEVEADGTVIASQSSVPVSTTPISLSINGPTLSSLPEITTMYYFAVIAEDSGANKEFFAIEYEFIPAAKRLLVVNDYNSSETFAGAKYYADDTYKGSTSVPIVDATYMPTSIRAVDGTNQVRSVSVIGTPGTSNVTVPSMTSLQCISTSGESPYPTVVGGTSSAAQSAISLYEVSTTSWDLVPIGDGNKIVSISRSGLEKFFVVCEIQDAITYYSHEALSYDPSTESIEALTTIRAGAEGSSGPGTTDIYSKIKVAPDESYFITFGTETYNDFGDTLYIPFMAVHSQSNGWAPVTVSVGVPSGYSIAAPSGVLQLGSSFRDAIIDGPIVYVVGTMFNETTSLIVPALYTVNVVGASAVGVELPISGAGDPEGVAQSVAIHNGELFITGWSNTSSSGLSYRLTTWQNGVYQDRSGLSNLAPSGAFPRGVFAGTTG